MLATTLRNFLLHHPADSYLIAYSGGLDSTVLLHAMATLSVSQPALTVRAVHINHGLQAAAVDWVQHCQVVCAQLGIELEVVVLNLHIPSGASVEAVARHARYQAFETLLSADSMLLTAHHQDDQAETLLLNLLRGSGMEGLAAMPVVRPLGASRLGRPLLGVSRSQLEAYATTHQLSWVEDPSNQNTDIDRNFLRQQVFPVLRQHWPAAAKSFAQVAQWQAESKALLADYLQVELADYAGVIPGTLSVGRLHRQSAPKCKAILRHWLHQQDFPRPPQGRLSALLQNLLTAKADASPVVSWEGCEVRRYRDDVFALSPLSVHDSAAVYPWLDTAEPLRIASLNLTLQLADFGVNGLSTGDRLSVRFRCGGERLQRNRQPSINLKAFFQEQGIPPWQRDRIPLLYADDAMVAVLGLYPTGPSSALPVPFFSGI